MATIWQKNNFLIMWGPLAILIKIFENSVFGFPLLFHFQLASSVPLSHISLKGIFLKERDWRMSF